LRKCKDKLVTPELIEELIKEKVNEEKNNNLTKDFTYNKISDALFKIGPLREFAVFRATLAE
jgi:hypothetical protein